MGHNRRNGNRNRGRQRASKMAYLESRISSSSSSCSVGSEVAAVGPSSVSGARESTQQRVVNINDSRNFMAVRPIRISRNPTPMYNDDEIVKFEKASGKGRGRKKVSVIDIRTRPKKLTPRREEIIVRFLQEDRHGPVQSQQWKQELISVLSKGSSISSTVITSKELSEWMKSPNIQRALRKVAQQRKSTSMMASSGHANGNAVLTGYMSLPSEPAGAKINALNANKAGPVTGSQNVGEAHVESRSVDEDDPKPESGENAKSAKVTNQVMEQSMAASIIVAGPNSSSVPTASKSVALPSIAALRNFEAFENSYNQYQPVVSTIRSGSTPPVKITSVDNFNVHLERPPEIQPQRPSLIPGHGKLALATTESGRRGAMFPYSQRFLGVPQPQPTQMVVSVPSQMLPYKQLPSPTGTGSLYLPLTAESSQQGLQSPFTTDNITLDGAISAWQTHSQEMIRTYNAIGNLGLINNENRLFMEMLGNQINGVAACVCYMRETLKSKEGNNN